MSTAPEFIHRIEPSQGRQEVLVLLHGTGADEHDLVDLGQALVPGAAILSPRGKSRDEGVNRWFRRFAEGLFDVDDLHAKTAELAAFLDQAMVDNGWQGWPVTLVGYSNGANMAASLLLSGLSGAGKAVLLRPMLPFEPEVLPNLSGRKVLIASGERDPICLPSQGLALEELLVRAGAAVEVYWAPTGHGLTEGDFQAARDFLGR